MEDIAELIDKLDNLISAMSLPVPAETHLSALRAELPEVRDKLKYAYFNLGGFDHWAE